MDSSLAALWVVVAALIVLLLPGFAWLVLFWERDQDFLEQVAGVIGSSISLTAITVLGFDQLVGRFQPQCLLVCM